MGLTDESLRNGTGVPRVEGVGGPERHLWRTPHGRAFLVDHTGTTRLTAHQSAAMSDAADDGVELYFSGPVTFEGA